MSPGISVILATDRYETIRPVVECLRQQTVKQRIELVIVAPDRTSLDLVGAESDGFAGVRLVEVAEVETLGPARAAGVRASSAPVIVIGETHTYPHPGWAEGLLDAHAHPWAVVVPGFGNANPHRALSWAAFLLDYGRWLAGLPAGEATLAPTHNSSYKRETLLELGPALETALAHGDEMARLCRRHGRRAYFAPAARIDHLNISRPAPWLGERFLCGLLIGGRRAQRWPWRTRLLYFAGSPLIPAVILSRVWSAVRLARRQTRLPAGTMPALLVGALVSAVGEAVGYARGVGRGAAVRMTEYEMHKVRYAP